MNNTGIVRKIDDLGRIVLPKELRNTMNLHSGDDLKITILNETILLEKYSKLDNIEKIIDIIINGFCTVTNYKIYVVKNNKVNDEYVDNYLINKSLERKIYINERKENIIITKSIIENGKLFLMPIIINSDLIGTILIIHNDSFEKVNLIGNLINKIIVNILLSR